MKVLVATANNFTSYKELVFKADKTGLTLISGPTGSGKSALCDLIPWVLFGVTAKGGTADEVISWNAEGVTQGTVILETSNKLVSIVRQRGKGQNDLFFSFEGQPQIRGKDLKDTQKLLNDILGMNAAVYLSGSYFHEFCDSATFFRTTPKARREIIEQVVDLAFHKRLAEKSKEALKAAEKQKNGLTAEIRSTEDRLAYLVKSLSTTTTRSKEWQKTQEFKLADLRAKAITYDEDMQAEIASLKLKAEKWDKTNKNAIEANQVKIKNLHNSEPGTCPECGGPVQLDVSAHIEKYTKEIANLSSSPNPWVEHMINAQMADNTYTEQANSLELEENPHNAIMLDLADNVDETKKQLKTLKDARGTAALKISDLELLQECVANFRAQTVKNTVLQLETNTNNLIAEYFDGEVRVNLEIAGDDKLDVVITKDGNTCSYSQLSKGQRQLLRLSFGVAVMEGISNQHGIKFEQLFFDEALDGLDEILKIKAISLFEKLSTEHNSVYIVEHSSSVKAMINDKLEVTLVNGESQLEEP